MIASQAGRSAEIRQGDASYRPASRASGWPRTGSRPVQFGMAVRRDPATAAITKPNSLDRPLSLGADNTVLEATNQRENAEMFFVEHFSQFCQKRHRRTTALHAMQYEFAALRQSPR